MVKGPGCPTADLLQLGRTISKASTTRRAKRLWGEVMAGCFFLGVKHYHAEICCKEKLFASILPQAPAPLLGQQTFTPGGQPNGLIRESMLSLDRKSTRLNSSHLGISYA